MAWIVSMRVATAPFSIYPVPNRPIKGKTLIVLGNGMEREHIPVLSLNDLSDQVLLVQSLHHDNDDAVLFAVSRVPYALLVQCLSSSLAQFKPGRPKPEASDISRYTCHEVDDRPCGS